MEKIVKDICEIIYDVNDPKMATLEEFAKTGKAMHPEEVARQVAKDPRVESVDICTGDYELLVKLRTKDIDEYYTYIKEAIKRYGFVKTVSFTSLKQIKTEFVEL